MNKTYEARRGGTTYHMLVSELDSTEITIVESSGKSKNFYVPRSLILDYAIDAFSSALGDVIRKVKRI